jgi:hypothetical protein
MQGSGYIHSGMDNPLVLNQSLQIRRKMIGIREGEKQVPMYILCE